MADTFPFIHDLCGINENGLFEKSFKEIQPKELELKKENVSSTNASFLDIALEIKSQLKFLINGTLSHLKLTVCPSFTAIYPLKSFFFF